MKNRLSGLLLLTALVSGVGPFAQARTVSEPDGVFAPNGAHKSSPPSSMTVSMRGTIQRYDASTRTVTLSTSKGPVPFALGALTRIRRDGQVVDAATLQTFVGCGAVVRYSTSGGVRTVESVHVFGKAKR